MLLRLCGREERLNSRACVVNVILYLSEAGRVPEHTTPELRQLFLRLQQDQL